MDLQKVVTWVMVIALTVTACTRNDPTRLRGIAITSGYPNLGTEAEPRYPKEGQMFYTLTATLPDSVEPDTLRGTPEVPGDAGAEYITSSLSHGTSSPTVYSVTFSAAQSQRPYLVRTGKWEIDFTRGTLVERKDR